MVVSKKSLGVIVLLFIPCFAAGQNCVDSTTVKQDSMYQGDGESDTF